MNLVDFNFQILFCNRMQNFGVFQFVKALDFRFLVLIFGKFVISAALVFQ
jgi:hypothetical protein